VIFQYNGDTLKLYGLIGSLKLKMAAAKPVVLTSQVVDKMERNFNGYTHVFKIRQFRLILRILDGVIESFKFRKEATNMEVLIFLILHKTF
jgi:hypothetical protein